MKYNYFKSCLVLSLLSFLIGCSVNESNLELNSDTSGLSPKKHKEVLKNLQGNEMKSIVDYNGYEFDTDTDADTDTDFSTLLTPNLQINLLTSNSSCEYKNTIDVFSETIEGVFRKSYVNHDFWLDNNTYDLCEYSKSFYENFYHYEYEKVFYYDAESQLAYILESRTIPVEGSHYQFHEEKQIRIKNVNGDIKYLENFESYVDYGAMYMKASFSEDTYQAEGSLFLNIKNQTDMVVEDYIFDIYYPSKSSWISMIVFDKQSFSFDDKDVRVNFSIIVKNDGIEYEYYSYISFYEDNGVYIYTSSEDRVAGVNPVGKLVVNDDLSMDIYYLDDTGSYTSVTQ